MCTGRGAVCIKLHSVCWGVSTHLLPQFTKVTLRLRVYGCGEHRLDSFLLLHKPAGRELKGTTSKRKTMKGIETEKTGGSVSKGGKDGGGYRGITNLDRACRDDGGSANGLSGCPAASHRCCGHRHALQAQTRTHTHTRGQAHARAHNNPKNKHSETPKTSSLQTRRVLRHPPNDFRHLRSQPVELYQQQHNDVWRLPHPPVSLGRCQPRRHCAPHALNWTACPVRSWVLTPATTAQTV